MNCRDVSVNMDCMCTLPGGCSCLEAHSAGEAKDQGRVWCPGDRSEVSVPVPEEVHQERSKVC